MARSASPLPMCPVGGVKVALSPEPDSVTGVPFRRPSRKLVALEPEVLPAVDPFVAVVVDVAVLMLLLFPVIILLLLPTTLLLPVMVVPPGK